jgi:lipoprotein NlpD
VLFRWSAIGLVLGVVACASRQPAPVEERSTRVTPTAPIAAAPATAPGARPAAEADWRPRTYTVKRGDTLYGIALDHGLDYRELAAWNNLDNINVIRVGQVLRLGPPTPPPPPPSAAPMAVGAAGVQTAPLKTVPPVAAEASAAPSVPPAGAPPPVVQPSRNTETYKTQPKLVKEPYSEQALREVQSGVASAPPVPIAAPVPIVAPATVSPPSAVPPPPEPSAPAVVARAEARPAPTPADGDEKVEWAWPARGKIVAGFSEAANLKGIDIAGAAGQTVAASAGGKVVYAGTGLRGYGKLVIIKHNATYLSAYAHNKEILVKEGQQVARGQKIAEMGSTDADQVKLHFEIRRQGKPVDPLKYLPPA